MSTFTNKSTVELIPENKINSDWGVIRSGKASFNDFDESKYFDENGIVNETGIKFTLIQASFTIALVKISFTVKIDLAV